jgi:hypothetical protein
VNRGFPAQACAGSGCPEHHAFVMRNRQRGSRPACGKCRENHIRLVMKPYLTIFAALRVRSNAAFSPLPSRHFSERGNLYKH